MTPILVRPVREQLEHDRIVRLLNMRWRRRFDVLTNVGDEKNAPVRIGAATFFPDLVLNSLGRRRKLEGVIEVETTESVNNLEAMAQWAHLSRVRGSFYLFVPAGAVEIARRLCTGNQVNVTEVWSYHAVGEQMRFTMVYRAPASGSDSQRTKPRSRRSQTRRHQKTSVRKRSSRGLQKRTSAARTLKRPKKK